MSPKKPEASAPVQQASGMTDNEAAARGAIPGTTGPAPEKADRGGRTAGDAPLVGAPSPANPGSEPQNPLPPAEAPTEVVRVEVERARAPDGQPLTGPQTV